VVESFERIVKRDKVTLGLPSEKSARPDGLHIPIALLRSIFQLKVATKRAKITGNLLSAAMHIAFLRSPASNEFADLPETAQALMTQYANSIASRCPFLDHFNF